MSNSITGHDYSPTMFFESDVGIRLVREFLPKDLVVITRVCTIWYQALQNLDIWGRWTWPKEDKKRPWYPYFSNFVSKNFAKIVKAQQLIPNLKRGALRGGEKELLDEAFFSGCCLWKGAIIPHSDLEEITHCLAEICLDEDPYRLWVVYQYKNRGSLDIFKMALSNHKWQTISYAELRLKLLRDYAIYALEQDKNSHEETLSFILDKEKNKKVHFMSLEYIYNHIIDNRIDRPDLLEKIIDNAPLGELNEKAWFEKYWMQYDALPLLTKFIWSQYGKDKKEAIRLAKKYLPIFNELILPYVLIAIDLHIILEDLRSAIQVYERYLSQNPSRELLPKAYLHLEKRIAESADADKYQERVRGLGSSVHRGHKNTN